MKVEIQILEDHQAQIVAEFEPEALAAAKRRSAQQLAKRAKIPGFRPGKAPYNVIERVVGDAAILDSAIELLVNDNYSKILDEAKIEPYASGELVDIPSKEPPTFRFLVPLRPVVTLGDYHSVRRLYELPAVTEDDVNRVLRNLQERQAIIEPAERTVQAGDQVAVELEGHRKQVAEGQEATIADKRQQTVDVALEGDDTSNEWPFPGFSQHLIGMAAGEEKSLSYTFPDDYYYETLREAEGEFHVKIEGVKARTLPELNDEFAQGFGDFKTVDDLIARVRENLEQQSRQEYDSSYTEGLVTEVLALSTVKYPPQMLEHEIGAVVDEFAVSLERRGIELEAYLKSRSMEIAALREEVRPTAVERLKRSLLILELSKQENIQVSRGDVEMQTYQTMNQLMQNMESKDARKVQSKEFVSNLVSNITADMYTKATLEKLRAIAKGVLEAQELEAAMAAKSAPAESEAPTGDAESADTTPANAAPTE